MVEQSALVDGATPVEVKQPVNRHGPIAKRRKGDSGTLAAHPSTPSFEPKIRVLVADDHAMVRQGLCSLLKEYDDIQVIGEAANGEAAVTLVDQLEPDVVLMDVTMPKLDGIEAARLIKCKHPAVVVIGLSVHTAGQVEIAMKEAGAEAFMHKEAAVEQLYQTIHRALVALRN